MCDVGYLNVSHAYTLKDSSIPLLPNIPDDLHDPFTAVALYLFVCTG
jgi:hypothetical protein